MKRIFFLLLILSGAYLGQALFIFPGMWASPKIQFWNKLKPAPNGVERFLVATPDEQELEVWYLPAAGPPPGTPAAKSRTALVFHGEKSSLRTSFGIQKWLASIGIGSYGFDYRGFGASTGWPSEEGMEMDSQAVFQRILDREKAWPEDIVLVGESVGASLAATLGARHRNRTLFLLSPFGSYLDRFGSGAASETIGKLIRFRFPTATAIEGIDGACIVVAGLDSVALGQAANDIAEKAKAKNAVVKVVSSASAGTNELLRQFKPQLQAALSGCDGT